MRPDGGAVLSEALDGGVYGAGDGDVLDNGEARDGGEDLGDLVDHLGGRDGARRVERVEDALEPAVAGARGVGAVGAAEDDEPTS